MLTAMKQQVTRNHKAQAWALDDIVYHSDVTNFDRIDQVRSSPTRRNISSWSIP